MKAPPRLIERRLIVLQHIMSGLTDTQINKMYGFSRSFCRDMRNAYMHNPISIFAVNAPIGAPTKVTAEIRHRIEELTLANRRMSTEQMANLISQEIRDISDETVRKIRKKLGFAFQPPVQTFFLTDIQRQRRLEFAHRELQNMRDWTKVVFSDESYVWLGEDHRYLWRRPGERGPDVTLQKKKFGQKILIFAGFALGYKSKLIILRQGTVNGDIYVDDCIDDSGIIPDMNQMHGPRNWTLMQDGASAHTKGSTIEYLRLYCNLIEDWPSGSPDLNPIENLWAIIKRRISDLGATTLDDLIRIAIEVWDAIPAQDLENLVASMRSRLDGVVRAQGGPNGY